MNECSKENLSLLFVRLHRGTLDFLNEKGETLITEGRITKALEALEAGCDRPLKMGGRVRTSRQPQYGIAKTARLITT